MHRPHHSILLALVLGFAASLATAQDFPPRHSQMVRIESDPSGAELYASDSLLGFTPKNIRMDLLPSTTAWYPSRSDWNASMRTLPDSALSDIEGVVFLTFDRTVTVNSIPDNASVYDGDTFLGRTPLRLQRDWSADTLIVLKPGYDESSVFLSSTGEAPAAVRLQSAGFGSVGSPVQELKGGIELPPFHIVAASAAGLGSGIAAVALKRKADARYSSYLQFVDESDLDASRRYDLYSGIALAILQVTVIYLVYELFVTP